MNCLICKTELENKDFCPNCQLDKDIINKVFLASRRLYNSALIRAGERDISTAISLLKKSLEIDKKFSEARNLLGLLYFRIGEIGEAIEQWKISYEFYNDENNKAYYYMKKIYNSNNKRKFEQLKSTIKMYNEALVHINQKSEDLAIIKLRKAIHINPSFIKANNLLAFCHIKNNDISKAMHYINNVLAVDSRNPIAINYKECTLPQEDNTDEKNTEGVIDKDIDPFSKATIFDNRKKETGIAHLSQIVIFIIGLAIGGAAIVFLYTPDKISQLNAEIEQIESTYEYKIEEKNAILEDAQLQINNLQDRIIDLENELKYAQLTGSQIDEIDKLLSSIQLYINDEISESASQLIDIDESKLTLKGKETRQILMEKTFPTASYEVFLEARRLYEDKQYSEAIPYFEKALEFSANEWYTEECYYKIARAYKELGLLDKSKQAFDIYFSKYTAETGGWYQYAVGHYSALQ